MRETICETALAVSICRQIPSLAASINVFYSFPLLGMSMHKALERAAAGDEDAKALVASKGEENMRRALKACNMTELYAVLSVPGTTQQNNVNTQHPISGVKRARGDEEGPATCAR